MELIEYGHQQAKKNWPYNWVAIVGLMWSLKKCITITSKQLFFMN